jgi:dolichol-phosphate mannosyltransferase
MTVSAVVPTYQEAQTAPDVVTALSEVVADEVVVVDDSPTRATIEAILAAAPETTVVRRAGDGLASAVIRGFAAASGDTYVVCDGDGQHPPATAAELAHRVRLDGVDLAVGSRHTPAGRVADAWPMRRRLISLGADILARAAVPPARQLRDPLSGLFAVDAAVVEPALERLAPAGYKILLELLARCPIESVAEVGYEFRTTDSESNLGAREYARYLRHLGRLTVPSRRREPLAERVRSREVAE